MTKRRTRTVAGSARRNAARLIDCECSIVDRRSNPESARSNCSAAPAENCTSGITCAGQSHMRGPALRDDNLHSPHATSLGAAPRPHHDGRAPRTEQPWPPRAVLPLPALLLPASPSGLFCTVTPIDDRGRLADRSPIRVAGWAPGQPVTISMTDDRRLVYVRPDGPQTITHHGHLRLPAAVRYACGLSAGDRLLVTVAATPPLLTVYPMAAVEAILRQPGAASTAGATP
jgi:hypothetical protein